MKQILVLTWVALILFGAVMACSVVLYIGIVIFGIVGEPRHQKVLPTPTKISSTGAEIAPTQLPAITIEDIKKCNRNTTVYEQYKPKPEEPSKKPPLPNLPKLGSLTLGDSGWITYLESYNGKVYADSYEDVAPSKNDVADSQTYDGTYFAHTIHVLVVQGGVQVDCDHEAFIEPQDGNPYSEQVPVVGMFRYPIRVEVSDVHTWKAKEKE